VIEITRVVGGVKSAPMENEKAELAYLR